MNNQMPIYNIEEEILQEDMAFEKGLYKFTNLSMSIKGTIKDAYRTWYAIKEIHITREQKELLLKIINEAQELCSELLEIIESNANINYETTYDLFLEDIKQFYKIKVTDNSIDTYISTNELMNYLHYFDSVIDNVKKKQYPNSTYLHAIYIIVNRSISIINKILYNSSSIVKHNFTDKKGGIKNTRYGGNNISSKIDDLEDEDIQKMIKKLKSETNYNEYKKLFDTLCDIYGKTDVSAIKLLNLDRLNKLVFVSYGALEKMTLKAGTKLYHLSGTSTRTEFIPSFKSKDGITYYSSNRIYFTDKDPTNMEKSILGGLENPNIYEYTCTKDTIAYRDPEYGSWYHNCIYIETNKPIQVKNVTNQVISDIVSKSEDKNNNDITEEVKSDNYEDSIKEFEDATMDVKNSINSDNINTISSNLDKAYDKYSNLSDNDKSKKTGSMIGLFTYIASALSHKLGITKYMNVKRIMSTIKANLPITRNKYNEVKDGLFSQNEEDNQ